MTLLTDCAWALLRSAAIAAAALPMACAVRDLLAASRRARRLLWLAHLVPFLTPVLLVGYAYSRFSLSLIHHPAWNQALYAALVWLKLVPVATLALVLAPSPVSPEAVHCHRLLRGAGRASAADALRLWLRGAGRSLSVAFALVFLLAFGEFEMASLLGVRTWTVSLFDAQIGGTTLGASARLALPALACQAALLSAVLWLLLSSKVRLAQAAPRHPRPACWWRAVAWGQLAVALAAVTLVPAVVVLRGTVRGVTLMTETLRLSGDIVASVLVALAAAACTVAAARLLTRRLAQHSRARSLALCLACLPGLLGALLLALAVQAAFQLPGPRALYDTPLPLVVALALLLLPLALLLRVLLAALRPGDALHAAHLLAASPAASVRRAGRQVDWELRGKGQFCAAFLLFCWAYFDLTASSLLTPSRITPVLSRLYNFMHYGQTTLLSAMVCLAFAVPFALLAVAWGARAAWRRIAV
ncbi:hypothetical protein HQ576_11065 [bacterium]|nr:hypothetical protein [bacterium]